MLLKRRYPEGLPSTPTAARIARLRADVGRCAVPRDHVTEPRANARIRDWLVQTLRTLGYEVTVRGTLQNIVALPQHHHGAFTLVGAHYDSVPMTPGADDNASAIAVMLEAARSAPSGVGFVAFNAEERGLAGSSELVRDEVMTGRLAVHAAHILEMVGFTNRMPGSQRSPLRLPGLPSVGDFIGLLSNHASRRELDRVLSFAEQSDAPPTVALQTYLGAEKLVPDLLRSDHAPFWAAGIPAVLWTDTAEFRNPHYHRPSDTPDTLDYDFMASVATLLEATLSTPRQPCRSKS